MSVGGGPLAGLSSEAAASSTRPPSPRIRVIALASPSAALLLSSQADQRGLPLRPSPQLAAPVSHCQVRGRSPAGAAGLPGVEAAAGEREGEGRGTRATCSPPELTTQGAPQGGSAVDYSWGPFPSTCRGAAAGTAPQWPRVALW